MQRLIDAVSNPKIGIAAGATGATSWWANLWVWLPENIGLLVGVVSVAVGLISIYNQYLEIRIRRRKLKKSEGEE